LADLLAGIDLTGIRFGPNSASLTDESQGIVQQVAGVLQQIPEAKIQIGGHTDSRGDYNYNVELSTSRANAVRDRLVELGVGADRLAVKGFGPDNPIATNDTREGRASNRRIEFQITTGD